MESFPSLSTEGWRRSYNTDFENSMSTGSTRFHRSEFRTRRTVRLLKVQLAHIGIAVRSIYDARVFYEEVLGLQVQGIEEIASEGVKVAFIPFDGGEIELLEPTDPDTPVGRFLDRHGEGLHHVSFDVPDVREAILTGIEHGVETVGEAPRMGAEGREIAFFHPLFTHGVLVEVAGPRGEQTGDLAGAAGEAGAEE